jgi:DNA primase
MGLKAGFVMVVPPSQIDWPSIRDRLDMAKITTALLGPAPGRRGERGRKLWWGCPFHKDANPSLCVELGKPWWRCWGCGEHGDAAGLAMKLQGVPFPEAARWLADQVGGGVQVRGQEPRSRTLGSPLQGGKGFLTSVSAPGPAKAPDAPDRSSGISHDDALSVTETSKAALWAPGGAEALAYLRERGLVDDTIRSAGLGWVDKLRLPKRDGSGTWPLSGVVLPWFDRGRLSLVKVRRLGLVNGPKYVEVFRDRPLLYPGRDSIRFGAPLIVCEGEFDSLLLGQELAGLDVGVVTLGSATGQAPPGAIDLFCTASRLFIATDGDGAGDLAASKWPAHATRARPPAPSKDWTEAAQAGVDLRAWWSNLLAGIESPAPPVPDVMAPEILPEPPWYAGTDGVVSKEPPSAPRLTKLFRGTYRPIPPMRIGDEVCGHVEMRGTP